MYNVAVGDRTTLNDLFNAIKNALNDNGVVVNAEPIYREFRAGDVRHSQADIQKARNNTGFEPSFNINDGVRLATEWYVKSEV